MPFPSDPRYIDLFKRVGFPQFCVLDHKLNVCWGAGYERLGLAKDFVVFLHGT